MTQIFDFYHILNNKTKISKMQKYSVNQHLIENILSMVGTSEIVIPEIQRLLVWNVTKHLKFQDYDHIRISKRLF